MDLLVTLNGDGKNTVKYYSIVGNQKETIELNIEEIDGIKYKKMTKMIKVDPGFRQVAASAFINGKSCVSVRDIHMIQ